jgi:hypothetical protein
MPEYSNQQWTEFVQDVLISIHENIADLREKKTFADPEERDYIEGRLFSYHEFLAILRHSADMYGLDARELGL